MQIRLLRRDEVGTLWAIDRSEIIDAIYVLREGRLVLTPEHHDVRGWPPGEPEAYTPLLLACHDRGGAFFGAFDGAALAGAAVLDTLGRGSSRDLLQLMFLHVGSACRGRGLGAELFGLCLRAARARGAAGLYVSATESQATVDFYRRRGCTLAATPDPDLFALEPRDIHLEYRFDDGTAA